MPKFVLILMVKNEEKILKRCLEAVEGVVDAFVITDTGSTDKTVQIAHEFLEVHKGCLGHAPWKDFGSTRSASFAIARDFCVSANMDLADTYGLLLDADMMFVPGTLRQQALGGIGYTIIQSAGPIEYPNTRLVRMDYPWVCKGVTHEYWDGECAAIPKSVCYIDDHNDGGCKADKFTRDLALLEKGLEEDPTNVRYMFYLAQTHHSMGNWLKAIEAYQRRIAAGGWYEEVWYSHYMIAKTYEILNDPIQLEVWVQKAYAFYPGRSEAIYCLAKHFRIKGEHYRAMHYIRMGKRIPLPTDALFIEKDVYRGLFDYEETICKYYTLCTKKDALRECMNYLMSPKPFPDNVYDNLKFYIEPVDRNAKPVSIHRHLFGPNFHPSVISVCGDYQNIRFVNYNLNHTNTTYTMKDGSYSDGNTVRTQNACLNTLTGETICMNDSSIDLRRRDAHIKGLEDIRLFLNSKNELCFLATTAEYSDSLSILRGRYHPDTASYSDCVVMESPKGAVCEKNWLPISGTDQFIYQWHPFEVRAFDGAKTPLVKSYPTPGFFRHLRGSARPIKVKNELWALSHFVIGSTPRIYYHCIVALDAETYQPRRMTLPFLFYSDLVEFCISLSVSGKTVTCMFAVMDDTPYTATFTLEDSDWIQA